MLDLTQIFDNEESSSSEHNTSQSTSTDASDSSLQECTVVQANVHSALDCEVDKVPESGIDQVPTADIQNDIPSECTGPLGDQDACISSIADISIEDANTPSEFIGPWCTGCIP